MASLLPTSGRIENSTALLVPALAVPVGLALAVINNGVNVPAEQLTQAQPLPVEVQPQVVPQAPTREEEIQKARKPVVYPRKQARY